MMFRSARWWKGIAGIFVCSSYAGATTYYVSPTGSDSNSGTSAGSAWASVAKVDATTFAPGSQILFQSGGNWYGQSLVASSSGTTSQPITYGSYGSGQNPTLWGSVVAPISSFQSVNNTTYFYPSATPINSFYINHQFFNDESYLNPGASVSQLISDVENTPFTSAYLSRGANSGEIFNTNFTTQYNTPLNVYTAAITQNLIDSNSQNNLVFQNFNVRESAAQGAGWGIRVENSSNVQVLNSTVTAAGVHGVGVTDSTGFVGQNLTVSYLAPNQDYGGATAFASYSDQNAYNNTSQWINDSFTNANGQYQAFITHVNNAPNDLTPIANVTLQNLYANTNPAITVQTTGSETVNITGGQSFGDLQLQGSNITVNGMMINGQSEIQLQGSNNVIENTIINGDTPNWTSARNGAIDVSGANNIIRFNSILLGASSDIYGAAIALEGDSYNTQIYANIIDSPYAVFLLPENSGLPSLKAHNNLFAGANVPYIIYINRTPSDTPVASLPTSISADELYGNAGFVDPTDGDFELQPGAIAAYVFNPTTNQYVLTDYEGNARPAILDSLGAIEVAASGTTATAWNVDASGTWETAGNWSLGAVPNATDTIAMLGPIITAARTVTVNGADTVGTLYFASPISYTLAGNGSLTLSVSSGTAAIDVSAGNHTITVPLIINSPTVTNIAGSSVLTLAGHVTGTSSITADGGGTLLIATTAVMGVPLIADGPVTIATNVSTGGIQVLDFNTLTLGPQGYISLPNSSATNRNNRTLLVTAGLNYYSTTSGLLDVTDNDVDVENGNLAQLTYEVSQGYANGTWNGSTGILSSTAAADTTYLTALGIIQNSVNGSPSGAALYGASGSRGLFDGTSPADTDVLIKFTYYGDANLDGKVDGSDYARIDNGFRNKLTGWYNGDFNYDGIVDGSDYALIDNSFNTQGSQLSAEVSPTVQDTVEIARLSASSAVPEPSSMLLLSGAALALLSRRRCRKRSAAISFEYTAARSASADRNRTPGW